MASLVEIDAEVEKFAAATGNHDVGLELAGVTKYFGKTAAVRDISLVVRRGEVHALLGENGAGKSTLMAIASGDLAPDQGTVVIGGEKLARHSASDAQRLGLAIAHQHAAVLPELTVRENMLLAVPQQFRRHEGSANDWVATQLKRVGATVSPSARLCDVDLVQIQLIELAKTFAVEPKVLILDEPTAALTTDLVEILFANIREAASRGVAIVYISHRLQEVRQIADRISVMRDGALKGSAPINEVTDDQILKLIVGRAVTETFPSKWVGNTGETKQLVVNSLSGAGFHNISMSAHGGEIVGIAGISGNGQSEFLRALAGLVASEGSIALDGRTVKSGDPTAARAARIVYLSSDRQKEGAFLRLSVRENATISSLSRFVRLGLVNRTIERMHVEEQRSNLNIRTGSIEQPMATLSGGNQQKTILARALLADPALVLAEEPTAGVDIGARAEIYRILRDLATSGKPVVIVSSDLVEVEGLCDRVLVFSRGQITEELVGDAVREQEIGRAIVTAVTHHKGVADSERLQPRLWTLLSNDYSPLVVLSALILLLAVYASAHNIRFISAFNVEKTLLLSSALAFVAFGQLCVVLTGRIDLSAGPLVGLTVVISSFFLNDGAGGGTALVGVATMVGAAVLVGLVNGGLVRFGNFTAVAATLGTYIILQGVSVLLRPYPDGPISAEVMAAIQVSIGGIPVVFILAVALGIILELTLRYTRLGMSIRSVGSDELAAARIGVRSGMMVVGAFVTSSLLAMFGGLIVTAQLGIGDPNQGIEYTLASIAAVVLGGASLFGGRGSFVGVLLAAVLIPEINSSMVFLGLSQAWQYWFIGLLTLLAVALYSQARLVSPHDK
ncbi:ATP-binding cassette domain-containing protein [Mesorhizobium sp. ANAO-SY3R2]|uniref:ATP-binding cassette domain-containing protein n=1 Tax=Mesorhizobium sp. ANAO-SY3R2 TaxID=3166644 RepID=UPI00366C9AC6